MPTISVIVPVYKVEKYIHCCIDSILNQTYRDFELILVDDGSPDNCGSICDEYAAKDSRVVVIHQENSGLSAARNAGIDWAFTNSDSEWLTFIDSDDWVHIDYLKALYEAALTHNVLLCQCGCQDVHSEVEIIPPQGKISSHTASPTDIYLLHGATVAMRKLIHRSLMQDLRYPIGKLHEDEYIMYQVFFSVTNAAIVNANLYYYRLREDSIMHQAYSIKRLDVLDAYENQLSYFKSKRMTDIYHLTANRYLRNLAWQYKECQKIEFPNKAKHLRDIRRRTLGVLLRTGGKIKISIKKNPDVFEVAFPGFMYLYWGILAQLNNIRKRFS